MSRTKKRVELREKLIDLFNEYAHLACDWDLKAEDDLDSFENSVDDLIEEYVS